MNVHVWGPPEDEMVGFDERTCVEEDRGEETIFHVEPREFFAGNRACMACGEIHWKNGARAEA